VFRHMVEIKASGARIGTFDLIGLGLRKTLSRELVTAIVLNHKAGLGIPWQKLELHSMSGGDVSAVVKATLLLQQAGEDVGFDALASADLDGLEPTNLAEAYSRCKATFPALTFDEFLQQVSEDEGVLGLALEGDFTPTRYLEGWVLRFEFGPLKQEEIPVLLRRFHGEGLVTFRKPHEAAWHPISAL